MSRNEGSRGHAIIEDWEKVTRLRLEEYIKKSQEELITDAINRNSNIKQTEKTITNSNN